MSNKKNIVIITGANKGLGQSFFNKFMKLDEYDLFVSSSRNTSLVQRKLIAVNNDRFLFIPVDLSKLTSTKPLEVLENFCQTANKVTFISNAGVILPIESVGNLKYQSIFDAIQVNVTSPTIIINYIMAIFQGKSLTILNISSGAANYPIDGLSLYCCAKSFISMFVRSIDQQETDNPLIRALSVDPGLIDSDMQRNIRNSDIPGFTDHSDFVTLKNQGALQEADDVVDKILAEINII